MPSKNEKMQEVYRVLAAVRDMVDEHLDEADEYVISSSSALDLIESAVKQMRIYSEEGPNETDR